MHSRHLMGELLLSDGSNIGIGLNITERKRAGAELARSHQLITALNQVATHLQTSLVPDTIMETLGAELEPLGLTCVVTLTMPDGKSAVVRYMSFESRLLELAEKLMGAKMQGYLLSCYDFPYVTQVMKQKRGVFVPDLLAVVIDLLHFIPKPLVEQAGWLETESLTKPRVIPPVGGRRSSDGNACRWG